MAAARFVERLNEQIAYEFAASQQYIANAVYYDAQTLPRLAAFFYAQAVEERNHAMMMVRYLLDADAEVAIPGVAAPETAVRGRRRPGRARARAGEARQRPDRRAGRRRARGERLPQRAVRAVVPQGAGRGGRDDVVAAGGRAALGRRAELRRGLPGARAQRRGSRRSDRAAGGRRRAVGGSINPRSSGALGAAAMMLVAAADRHASRRRGARAAPARTCARCRARRAAARA